MSAVIDWESDRWGVDGHNTHEAAWAPDRHDIEPEGDAQ